MTTVNLNLIPVDETQLVLAAGDDTQLVLSAGDETQIVLSSVAASSAGLMMTDGSNSALALGSAGTPSLKFAGDANTGIYSPGADQVAVATNGVQRLTVDTAATTSTLPVALPLGAVATPSITFTGDLNTGFWSPTADTLAASTAGSERLRITSTGNVGIGTSSPGVPLEVNGVIYSKISTSGDAALAAFNSIGSVFLLQQSDKAQIYTGAAQPIVFTNNNTERARIDSSGRLLVGTSSARNVAAALQWNQQIEGTFYTGLSIVNNQAGSQNAYLVLGKSRGTTIGSSTIVSNNDGLGAILFAGADGTDLETQAGQIACEVDGTPGANDMPGRLVFSTTADGAASPTERMRIKSTGIVNIANTPTYADNAAATAGGLVAGDIYRTSTGQLMIRY